MRPIPLALLPDTMVYEVLTTPDGWGGGDTTPTTVEHVRLEPSSQVVNTKDNTEVRLKSTLIIDGVNSTPVLDYTLARDNKITVGGQDYKVQTVDALKAASGAVHYWELGLI